MSRILLKKDITLCREDGSKVTFHIKRYVGCGASCVVYHATCDDNTEHLLKEYYPRNLTLERDLNGTIIVPEYKKEDFDKGLKLFRRGVDRQRQVRIFEELKNYTSNVQGYFYGNNTEYVAMTVLAGQTYNEVKDESLHTLLLRMRTLAQVIGHYHNAGLLHLDIKPENIYVRPQNETAEDVMLFDFDSVVEKDNIMAAPSLSYTKDWAAPEQLLPYKRNSICEATDLFSIGEIIFTKIFGRHSTQAEHRCFADYKMDYNAEIFKNTNPKVVPLIKEIFSHTICNVAAERYQTTEELIEKLDEAIKFADPKIPFLQSFSLSDKFFVGRDKELIQIEKELQNTDRLYISGMGGIGKSKLVEQYAKNHKSEYDAIIIATYTTDIKSMICNISIANIEDQSSDQNQDDYLRKKLEALQNIGKENKIFLIIDNFNVKSKNIDAELFDNFTACAYKTVITTRNNVSEAKVINLNPLESARPIFDNYYKKPLSDNDSQIIDRIIAIYQNHTLATELLAKQMAAGRINPKDMLKKLNHGGFKNSGLEKIKAGSSKEHNAYSYMRTLFDVSELSEDERYILLNLSLIPPTGISAEIFYKWCDLSTYDDINVLETSGWVNRDVVNDIISLHPVVADIMLDELERKISCCTTLLKSITKEKTKNYPISLYDFFVITNYMCQKVCDFKAISAPIIDFLYSSSLDFYRFGGLKTYIVALKRAIEDFGKNRDSVKVNLAQLHNALGILYKNDDLFSYAEEQYKTALSLGEDQNFLISVYCNLINLYCSLEHYEDAVKLYTQSLDKCKDVYKEDNLHIANIYSHLGVINHKHDKFKEAENYYKKALRIRINCLGETSGDTAYSHNDLGALYQAWGRFTNAENEYRIALKIRLDLYGEKHRDIITSYTNFAVFLTEQKKFDEAEEKNDKALKLCYDIYGNDHSETAVVLNNIGFMYGIKKQYDLSEKHFKRALQIWNKKFNGIHTKIATAKQNLGVFYREQKRFSEAIQMLLEAKNIYTTIHKSEEHTSVASVCSALGKTYALMGDSIRAEEYYQKSLKIRQELLDPNDERIKLIEKRIEELKK